MSAEILLPENYPPEWRVFGRSYNSENNGTYNVDTSVLNYLLKLEIVLDEMMKHGVAHWENYDECMEKVAERLKGDEE